MSNGRNDEREFEQRLDALTHADPGPSSSDLAEARLMLKRALAREQGASGASGAGEVSTLHPAPVRELSAKRWVWLASQAAGFVLLVVLLVPVVPRMLPARSAKTVRVDLVANLADEARSMHERLKPYLPSLPSLPSLPAFPLPDVLPIDDSSKGSTDGYSEMRSRPADGLLDWIQPLHSDAR